MLTWKDGDIIDLSGNHEGKFFQLVTSFKMEGYIYKYTGICNNTMSIPLIAFINLSIISTMAAIHQHCSLLNTITITLMLIIIAKPAVVTATFQPSPWTLAHATFYGDETASATMGTSKNGHY